jgi:CBS domain-containing protein
MGAEAHTVSDSLLCVMAQRLVRKICQHCRARVEPKPEHLTLLGMAVEAPEAPETYLGTGCEHCDQTGYRGRLGLYELLTVTSSIRQQMLIDTSEEALWHAARAEGMTTLLEDGLAKVSDGLTSLDEVLRVVTVRRKPGLGEPARTALHMPVVAPAVEQSPRLSQTVRKVMSTQVITVAPNASLTEVARLAFEKGVTGFPVVSEKGTLLGVVSVGDLVGAKRLPERARPPQTVREVMSSRVISIGPDEPLSMAAQMFWRHKVHRLLVLEGESLVGIVTPFDLMMAY